MPGAHVSAIIFPRRFDITPANAKGILQTVKNIQAEIGSQLEKPLAFSDLMDLLRLTLNKSPISMC